MADPNNPDTQPTVTEALTNQICNAIADWHDIIENPVPLADWIAASLAHRSQETARSADVGREGVTFEQAWSQKEAEGYNYGHDALEQVRFGWEMALASLATPPADSEKVENRFSQWSNTGLAGQCRMQARDQLDPEFSQFMIAVAERIERAALTTPPADDGGAK